MKMFLPVQCSVRLTTWALAAACAGAAAPALAQQAEPIRHVVRNGDTLYDLANAYLEDPLQWKALAQANGNPHPRQLKLGSTIVVPDALLRKKPGGARVVHVSGTVRYKVRGGAEGALEPGMRLIDGDTVITDSGGFATLEMTDGSIVRVTGDSELRLERLRYSLVKKRSETTVSLDKGRVESRVTAQQPTGSRFRVDTPLMAAGVRGTEFGVTLRNDGAATSDVLQGEVELTARQSGSSARVAAGTGGAVAAGMQAPALAPLLPVPDLSGVRSLQERPIIDLAFAPQSGAVSYRAFIWPAGDPERIVGNVVASQPRVRFAGLDDGDYVVRISAIDAQGIEGRHATWPIKLKARPEPPVTLAPVDGGTVQQQDVTLEWTEGENAIGYRVQLARDEAFADLLLDETLQAQTGRTVTGLASGTYYWRVASVARGKDGSPDMGPYGDPRRFMVRLPAGNNVALEQDGDRLTLAWDGEPGQRYWVQVSGDPNFATIAAEQRTSERQWAVEGLPAGEYFLRIQATDSDGFVREFTRPQRFRINNFIRTGAGPLRSGDGQEVRPQ